MVIGPESTGKSTLSSDLAESLNTVWVPEYARGYLEALERPYNESDLLLIAKGQIGEEERLSAEASRWLVCDTDLYVIKVWSEHSFGGCDARILQWIAGRKYDAYLLTFTDIEWSYDPLREHPEDKMRYYFYHQYRDIVMNSGLPWADIRGSREDRLRLSLEAIRSFNL